MAESRRQRRRIRRISRADWDGPARDDDANREEPIPTRGPAPVWRQPRPLPPRVAARPPRGGARPGPRPAGTSRSSGWRFWLVILLLGGCSALAGVTVRIGPLATPARWVQAALVPADGVVSSAQRAASAAAAYVRHVAALGQANAALRAQVAALQRQLVGMAAVQAENARLRQLVQLQSAAASQQGGVVAGVIGRDPSTWFDTLEVDRGSADGVTAGMVAVTSAGLIGQVTGPVSAHSASVMLLTNPDFGVGAMVARADSRAEGAAVGRFGSPDMVMTFFSPNASVRKGDLIVTSGLNGLFPKDLPIGTVVSVGPGDLGLVRQAVVAPLAAMDSIESVLLLPPVPPGG